MPELGVVPYIRNPRIGGAQIAELADACPNVIGVKYAVPDPVRFAAVARDAGLDRFVWVAGLAELYAPAYFAVGRHRLHLRAGERRPGRFAAA